MPKPKTLDDRLADAGLCTQQRACELLGLSRKTVRNYTYNGVLEGHSNIGVLIEMASVEAYLAKARADDEPFGRPRNARFIQ